MNIKRIGIVGAGTMGSAIAQHFAMKRFSVVVRDLAEPNLERAKRLIEDSLEEALSRKVLSEDDYKQCLTRLSYTIQLSDLSPCDLVIEAVFEDRNLKQTLFRELEKVVSPDCVLATNTSSYLVSDIMEGLKSARRAIGIHYFYHAAKNKLVEIIPSTDTDSRLVRYLYNFYYAIDKVPILCKDAPGFAVNRFFVPWLNEAVRLYEEGKGSIAFIDDKACEVFGIGMGPFQLMNATGVPIAEHAAQGLADRLGASYAPCESLKAQVKVKKNWDLSDQTILTGGRNDSNAVTERLLAASVDIAAKIVSEGVTDAASTDLGARVGLKWPKGPFEMMQLRGRPGQHKARWVKDRIVGNTGFIEFCIPDRMNALSEEVMGQLGESWDKLSVMPLDAVIITGRGKAFIAGADVKFFVDCIEKKDLGRIYRFTESGQKLLMRIEDSKIPVISYIHGLALGGGLELALACKYRIASPNAVLGFPETGIGIYPGLGGTQRTTRLIGRGLTKFLIATGKLLNAKAAFDYGLVHQLVDKVFDPDELEPLVKQILKTKTTRAELPPELSALDSAFSNFNGDIETLTSQPYREHEKILRKKAPIALQTAMSLIDEGEKLPLHDALNLELAQLRKVFLTKDALAGLKAVLSKEPARFIGA